VTSMHKSHGFSIELKGNVGCTVAAGLVHDKATHGQV
jgi:hypothetical protein